MTGFGEARHVDDRLTAVVEIRSVNNRHLKIVTKISDMLTSLESDIEKLVRGLVRRGTVHVTIKADRPRTAADYRLNLVALNSYREQIASLTGAGDAPRFADLLVLPGVVESRSQDSMGREDEGFIVRDLVVKALEEFQIARVEEGRVMGEELRSLGLTIEENLTHVEQRGPQIVAEYAERLLERLNALVESRGISLEAKELVREVAIHAERADITEEIIRLKAHLTQFHEAANERESPGRKLEFIVQEIGRETNTIGSKANDIEISRAVVEMKGALEKIRELIQNVE